VKFLSARATAAVVAVLCGAAAAGCSSSGGSATTTGDVSSMPIIHGLETTNLVVSAAFLKAHPQTVAKQSAIGGRCGALSQP